jgi:hypothetical protein
MVERLVKQWRVRLSPAGDGAEDAEGTCEKQERATWWMDVLVGGSGQGLFTWETKELAERHIATPRPRAGRSASGGPVGICKTLQTECIHRRTSSAPQATEGTARARAACRRRQ